MKRLMLMTSLILSSSTSLPAQPAEASENKDTIQELSQLPSQSTKDLKKLIKDCFKEVVENMAATEADYAKYMDKGYIQYVDGKTLNYENFVAHMKAQKQSLKTVKIFFHEIVSEGNKVATFHTAHAVKKDNKEVEAQIIAIFEIKNGKIISCKELTHMVKGEESDRDLGPRVVNPSRSHEASERS